MLFGYYIVYSSLFLALGKGREGFLLGALICFVPIILLLTMIAGQNEIIFAQPAADVLSALITVVMATRLHKELNSNQKQTLNKTTLLNS